VARARGRECHRLVSRRHFHRLVSRVNRQVPVAWGGHFTARMRGKSSDLHLAATLLLPPAKFPRPAFPCAHHETAGLGAPCRLPGLAAALPRFAGLSSVQYLSKVPVDCSSISPLDGLGWLRGSCADSALQRAALCHRGVAHVRVVLAVPFISRVRCVPSPMSSELARDLVVVVCVCGRYLSGVWTLDIGDERRVSQCNSIDRVSCARPPRMLCIAGRALDVCVL
jgi:hypothetical protein